MAKIDEIMSGVETDIVGQGMPNSAYTMLKTIDHNVKAKQSRVQEENRRIEQQNAPLLEKLQKQIDLLTEEAKMARKNEKSTAIVSWISIGIAFASLVCAILLHFI